MKNSYVSIEREEERIKRFIIRETKEVKGLVLGISGGIDSAVVAYLSARAIGPERLHGLMMPYDKQSIKDSELVAKTLGISYDVIDIKPIVDAYKITAEFFDGNLPGGNLRARVRMCLLYGYANKHGCKVIGTGNASEAAVGYFTKWGDGAVDLQPIMHLYKDEVWQLAEHLNIDKKIIEKAPSAELWEGQTDEGELGIDYSTLNKILKGESVGDKSLVEKISARVESSSHKRKMPKGLKRMGYIAAISGGLK